MGFGGRADGAGEGDKAAFANFFTVFAQAGQGKRHALLSVVTGCWAAAHEDDMNPPGILRAGIILAL